MSFQSILYAKQPDYPKIRGAIMPPFFADLNLDQVIKHLIQMNDNL